MAYTTVNAENPADFYKLNLYFADGKIVKFESVDNSGVVKYSFNFTNYGTTSIDLPDYLK